MDGRCHQRRVRTLDQFAAILRDAEARTQKRLAGSRAEQHDQLGIDQPDFRFKPSAARVDLTGARLLVNADFAARLPSKVLHCVRDIDIPAIDADFSQRRVEQLAGRPDAASWSVFNVEMRRNRRSREVLPRYTFSMKQFAPTGPFSYP